MAGRAPAASMGSSRMTSQSQPKGTHEMTPDLRLQLANDRIADLHRERSIDRLVASSRRPTARPPRTPLLVALRRFAGAFAAFAA